MTDSKLPITPRRLDSPFSQLLIPVIALLVSIYVFIATGACEKMFRAWTSSDPYPSHEILTMEELREQGYGSEGLGPGEDSGNHWSRS